MESLGQLRQDVNDLVRKQKKLLRAISRESRRADELRRRVLGLLPDAGVAQQWKTSTSLTNADNVVYKPIMWEPDMAVCQQEKKAFPILFDN